MSQRTTISTLSSAGMPIFQSSGLVPLHNPSYSIPTSSTHSKSSQSNAGAVSSGLHLPGQSLEPPGSRSARLTEMSLSSLSGAVGPVTQGGPPPLIHVLQRTTRGGEASKDHAGSLGKRVEGASVGNLSGRAAGSSNPVKEKLGYLDCAVADHSLNSQGADFSSESRHNPAQGFKPVANPRFFPERDNKVVLLEKPSVATEKRQGRMEEVVLGIEKHLADSVGPVKHDSFPVTSDTKDWHVKKMDKEDEEEEWVLMENNPFNMRIVNLNNFPTSQSVYRTNYRSHSVACVRAKLGSIQNTAKSLDLLRQILQKSINAEIDVILKKYVEEYFQPALENIRLNNGDNAVSVEHVNNVCRQILEEAKKMFSSDARSATPDIPDNVSDSGSTDDARNGRPVRGSFPPRKRKLSSGSESSSCALKIKKKGRFGSHLQTSSGRSTPSKKMEPIRREGPSWDSDRIKSDTLFVMGARANKALGLGATRGRLYIKHPEVFKYTADQDDKQWLYEKHLMPATGGKTYLLLVDDIKELAQSDEYRNSPGLLLDELVGFTAPESMLEKMRNQMNAMRTDLYKIPHLSRDLIATESLPRPSPANSETHEMSTEQDFEDDSAAVSPMNETGGFNQEPSPAPSQAPSEFTNMDDSDDEPPIPGSFYGN